MPYITNESLCKFCKHYRLNDEKIMSWKCDAFPDGIPVEIYASDMIYDHREPYDGDNGIQFELLEDEEELMGRFPRYSRQQFLEIVAESLSETMSILDTGRRNGYIDPPLQSDD